MKNDGHLLSFEYVKEHRENLLPKISEGCVELEKILNFCVDSNMPTIACCAGHKLGDKPYITMIYDKNTRRKINGFLNKLVNIKNVEVMFSTTGFTDNPFNVSIYTKRGNRDKIFSIINDCLCGGVESEYLRNDLNLVLNIAIMLDYRGNNANVRILNKQFQSKYMIGIYQKYEKGTIFDEYSEKNKKGSFGMHYYLYRDSKNLQLVSDEYEILHSDHGFRCYGFHISSDVSANEKVDRINEYNDEYAQHNGGSIRRWRT